MKSDGMTLVGKIFIGFIAFMSVVCLTLSAVSYASHRNWKDQKQKLDEQVKTLQSEKSALTAAQQEIAKKLETEKNEYAGMIAALKAHYEALEADVQALQAENQTLNDEMATYVNAFNTNNSMISDYRTSIESLTAQLAESQQSRAKYLFDLSKTVASLHTYAVKNGDLESQNRELTDAYDNALEVLNKNGLAPDPALYGDLPKFAVKGTIEKIQEGPEGLLMVSIGSDDGLNPGNKLEISRGDSYLGRVEVVTVEPNRAICKVLPEYRQGVMMEGDEVSSQFN